MINQISLKLKIKQNYRKVKSCTTSTENKKNNNNNNKFIVTREQYALVQFYSLKSILIKMNKMIVNLTQKL